MVTVASVAPRFVHAPVGPSRAGEVFEVAERAGLVLDVWQRDVLEAGLRVDAEDKWLAFEVGVTVSRQNGKGSILEARELGGVFVFEESLQIHSSHQFDTSLEGFRRLLDLVESCDEYRRQVKRVSRSHGEEGIEFFGTGANKLTGLRRIRFRTRTRGGGRGFTCQTLYLDEDMVLPEFAHGALLPTLSAVPNPQVWYMGSAVDQEVHEHGVVKSRLRERGIAGEDRGLVYFEWSAPFDHPSEVDADAAEDQANWAAANPALGIRIPASHVELEQLAMNPRTFAVERLGVGDWPRTDDPGGSAIKVAAWDELLDAESKLLDPVCLAFDVSPDRRCSVAAAGRRGDGLFHVEVIRASSGTGWLVEFMLRLVERHDPLLVVCDAYGPAASLATSLEEAGVRLTKTTSSEHGQACGLLLDAVEQRTIRHLGSDEIRSAIRGAATRPLGDAWAWSRRSSSVDISPLVAATLAHWASVTRPDTGGEMRIW